MKPEQYISNLNQKLHALQGKKGVVAYRVMVEKALKQYSHYIRLTAAPRERDYTINLWRRGLADYPIMDARVKACKLALKLPALWSNKGYDAVELQTNANQIFSKDIPEGYAYTDYVSVLRDDKAQRIFIKRHTAEYKSIMAELQPEFLPKPFFSTNSRNEVAEAVNIDLYGVDQEQGLYLIQVRYWRKGHRFNHKRKEYFLIGRNENKAAFCHSVEVTAFRNKKAYTLKEKVWAAQSWIFGVRYDQMPKVIRQGDMGFLPLEKALPKHTFTDLGNNITIGNSHNIYAASILKDNKTEKLYALSPRMQHTKQQHEDIFHTAWVEILEGKRKATRISRNSKD